MAAEIFRDDDAGYLAWIAAHPSGWLINAYRQPTAAYLKLHRVSCTTIRRFQSGQSRWTTGDYVKICAEDRDELDAWARTTVRGTLQDGCHCVQRRAETPGRVSRRPPPPPTEAAPLPSPPAVDAERFITIEAPAVIPFKPNNPTLIAARDALRAVLGGLTASPGELLHGMIEGPAAAGADLDNALLYNIGGRIAAAARHGVALQRHVRGGSGAGVRYRYPLTTDPAVGRPAWQSVVEFDRVMLGRPPWLWPDVWAAVRTSPAVRMLDSAPDGDLALMLRVGAPHYAGAANGQFVKTLVDGVLTALHAQADSTTADEIARRLAANLALGPDEIADLLLSADRAALGTCHRLIVLRNRGVQCLPEDVRLASLRIEIDQTATAWTLTGRVARPPAEPPGDTTRLRRAEATDAAIHAGDQRHGRSAPARSAIAPRRSLAGARFGGALTCHSPTWPVTRSKATTP